MPLWLLYNVIILWIFTPLKFWFLSQVHFIFTLLTYEILFSTFLVNLRDNFLCMIEDFLSFHHKWPFLKNWFAFENVIFLWLVFWFPFEKSIIIWVFILVPFIPTFFNATLSFFSLFIHQQALLIFWLTLKLLTVNDFLTQFQLQAP